MSNIAQDLAFVIFVGVHRVLLKYIIERKKDTQHEKGKILQKYLY
jgi:hypothetical protein